MMKTRILRYRRYFAFFALPLLFWIGAPASSQVLPRQDSDTTRSELTSLDRFMDSHPEIAEQLRKDPSLVNDKQFVEGHPALRDYLGEHPDVREEIRENPNAFMRQENHFDRREDNGEVAGVNRFLESHPEIAEQLRKDPSLVNNRQFVENHPALQNFLREHPGVREQFTQNPNAFMNREDRFDRREDFREMVNLDRFLDSHPELAGQLRRDPSLVNNRQFLANHPDLQQFLVEHPAVRQELAENPNTFMRQEDRFDRREDNRMEDNRMNDRDHDGELAGFRGFLGSHANISREISRDPSLVRNAEYLQNHPELQRYLTAHPGTQQELAENPQAFMKSVQVGSSGTTKSTTTIETKPKQ